CSSDLIPMLAIIMRGIHGQFEQGFKMFGNSFPFFGIGEIRTRPSAIDIIGEIVLVDVSPTDRIDLGRATPRYPVDLAGLDGNFDVFPRQSNRNNTKFSQKTPAGREGENP